MLYLLQLYTDPTAPLPDDILERHFAFAEQARNAGAYVYSEALQPPDTARTVYPPGTRKKTHDGPFAETKELFGGFYVLDCASRDEAQGYGEQLAELGGCPIEIRPIFNVPGWPYTIAPDRRG